MNIYHIITRYFALCFIAIATLTFISSCARMGNPDGGWYDETPPHVVSASPADKSVGVKANKVVINFDEFIKIENATEKVVVSPAQLEMPEIKASGKRIVVELKDTLMDDITYTIDFSDAISDNNEGNPLGNYTYSFSTGDQIDTLEVAGTVLNAEDLEPVKGTLVGLYADTADSAFTTKPLLRVSRTDSRGRFIIRGVAPGSYRVYALNDMDGDFRYSQASEAIAFSTEIFTPTCIPDTRQDTIWADSLHIRDIKPQKYTHFLPDNIVLRQFVKEPTDRYFLKCERKDEKRIDVFFSGKSAHTPVIKGLNFNSDDAFLLRRNKGNDSLSYWIKDTTLVNKDTLNLTLTYEMSDTAGVKIIYTDTLEVLSKNPLAKRMKALAKEKEDWLKDLHKKMKKHPEEVFDTIYHEKPLRPSYKIDQNMSPDGMITVTFNTPLARIDTSAVHIYVKKDEQWYSTPFRITQLNTEYLDNETYNIYSEWRPDLEYSFEIDTLAFEDIYGLQSVPYKAGFKVTPLNRFCSLFVNVSGVESDSVVVQLLGSNGKVEKEALAIDNTAEFYYIKGGTYYLKAFIDMNGNGKWDTGNFEQGLQPEPVYYNPEKLECKENWDLTRSWNLTATPLTSQKPDALIKQKADKEKTIRQRNAERAREKGIPEPFRKY